MHIARCTCTLEPWLSELSELSYSSVGLSDIVGHYRFSAASLHNYPGLRAAWVVNTGAEPTHPEGSKECHAPPPSLRQSHA